MGRNSEISTQLQRHVSKQRILKCNSGIREGGCGCFRNIPILEAAHYSGLAQFVFWTKAHLQRFPWEYALESNDTLHQCLAEAFANDITGMMQWQIPLANSPPEESLSQTKQLPLCIPTFNAILHWPEHLFPTQQAFCAHIKQELRQELYKSLQPHEQKRLDCVSRSLTPLSKHSHLDSSAVGGKCQLYQSPMAFFSLTNYHELSNEAVFTVTSLLLGIPMIHAIYLKNQQPEYVDKDVWGDFCLNNSSHAAETRFTTHHSLACEIASISNGAGVPSTCDESKLPYRDVRSRKRADLMTLVGCGIREDLMLNFGPNTRLIMDVSLVHIYDSNHRMKPAIIRDSEQRKRNKYADFYQRQGYAFAPMICNTLGQCGPDMLQFLWNLADRSARHHFGFNPIRIDQNSLSQAAEHDRDFRRLRGKLFNDYKLRLQTAIFEAVTMRVYGKYFALSCTPAYKAWIKTLQTEWHPLFSCDSQSDSQTTLIEDQTFMEPPSTQNRGRRPRSPTLDEDNSSRRIRRHVSSPADAEINLPSSSSAS